MPPEESTLDSGLVIRLIVCMAVNCQFVPFVIRNHPWLAASVLHGLLLLLAVVLLPIGYGVCDDVIIEWLIANDFSGWWYTGQLHPCLSFALGWVWEKLPGIAWYFPLCLRDDVCVLDHDLRRDVPGHQLLWKQFSIKRHIAVCYCRRRKSVFCL